VAESPSKEDEYKVFLGEDINGKIRERGGVEQEGENRGGEKKNTMVVKSLLVTAYVEEVS